MSQDIIFCDYRAPAGA